MGTWNGKQQKPIKVHCKFIPDNVKEIELNYHNGLELCFAYDDSSTNIVNTGTNEAAIDLGEIHTIASVCSNGNSIIITGRKLRSIKQFRNKKYAELQRLLSKCKKGSRQWKNYNKAKQHMLAQTDKQILDALHKITHKYVEFAVANEVKTVYVGKLEGVQRNTRKKKTKSHKVSQKLSQFMFGKVRQLLEYKLKAKGITLKEVDESYTSMTCPVCDRLKKPRGRVYSCVCGYCQHRDIHGSSNILTKQMYGKFQPMKIKPFSYERIA
jgi:putative transposase